MSDSASAFVAAVLDLLPFPPVEGVRAGTDARCWLCGVELDAPGWDRRDAFPPTFTNVNLAAVPGSFTVCQPCAAVSRGESWAVYAARRPELKLVTKHPISWRSYPHAVYGDTHEIPNRQRWRELLTGPPDPPFVLVLPTSKQKHLLFRSRIGWSRDRFPVQVEEDAVWVDRNAFAACLLAAERLLALRCARAEVETGRYSSESIKRAGMSAWRAAESAFAPWRAANPAWVRLVAMIGHRPEKEAS